MDKSTLKFRTTIKDQMVNLQQQYQIDADLIQQKIKSLQEQFEIVKSNFYDQMRYVEDQLLQDFIIKVELKFQRQQQKNDQKIDIISDKYSNLRVAKNPKPDKNLLDLIRSRDALIKTKEYGEADKMNQMVISHMNKLKKQYMNKLELDEKIELSENQRQSFIELQKYFDKKQRRFNLMLIERDKGFQRIIQSFINKKRDV
ncbi:UNKNOWN [Stylonychia lemnae]|uniref:Uncharacterized protein n=1 Tax=Stylonychia lemnae TaxID=5949 RepID=A0A078AGC1_STYLE|nr:UNKNOWN [Stylonychia lemnae]|eukprot:CDW81284.1 UNKNOWN [Stylonychia lemnae]